MRFHVPLIQSLSLLLTLLISTSASAIVNEDILNVFVDTLNQLQSQGIKQIDGKSIQSLKERARRVNISIKPYIAYWDGVALRRSGFWFTQGDLRYLALSEHRLNQIGDLYSPQGRGIIFHELAGPLEINDNNFNKSGLINMYLILNGINPRLIESTGSLDVVKDHIQLAGGGVSGVGGGGDNFILSFVELLYSEMFLGLLQKRLTLEQFSLLLEKISKLEIQYLEDIPQGEFLLRNSVLWVPPNSATNKNVEKNYSSVNRLIVELLNGGSEK